MERDASANRAIREGQLVDADTLRDWVDTFHRDGYLFLPGLLGSERVAQLRRDLDTALEGRTDLEPGEMALHPRMFECSAANLGLFDLEPIVSFAEALIDGPCHVVHNNSFRTPPGAGIVTWHQDDTPHYVVLHGEPPANVHLPVLLFTCNYYLTDVLTVEQGPTEVVPGSHRFGESPPGVMDDTPWAPLVKPCLGPAGSVVMFNCQVWHRGAPNLSETTRYLTQVSYGRRIIGHKYYPFMNYVMPEHVYRDANPRLRRLLGFLPSGAYG